MDCYSSSFYAKLPPGARQSARAIVPIIRELVNPQSVIDFGCGLGTWLSVFKEQGAADIHGVDGPWVRRSELVIPQDKFQVHDLSQPLALSRQFDLVMSLEVAEHLPAASAAGFIRTLTGMGPVILFSAAIPSQGGEHHVNEQWPAYWIELFAREGYQVVDAIRPRVWQNPEVDWFYAQNALLFVRTDHLGRSPVLTRELAQTRTQQLALVHPGCFAEAQRFRLFLERLAATTADIARLVPAGQPFILVDMDQIRPLLLAGSRGLPFLEKDGAYWGPPTEDAIAIAELERMRRLLGATFIVFAWPALWWLDHYTGFSRHLRTQFRCAAENEHVVAFDLRTPRA